MTARLVLAAALAAAVSVAGQSHVVYRDAMAEGLFTGKRLSDYFGPGKSDPLNARRIINGTESAAKVAGYHRSFVSALKAAGHGTAVPPEPRPTIRPDKGFWGRLQAALTHKAA